MRVKDAIDNLRRFDPDGPFMMEYCFERDEEEDYYRFAQTYMDFCAPEKRRLEVQEVIGNVVYLG